MQRELKRIGINILAVAGLGLTLGALVPRVHAHNWDKKTIVEINEPIIAGNKVLDPGTYVWKLLDSPGERHVVQIFDQDQQHLETTVLAIPNYRLHPTGKASFAFWETPAGVPKAVRAWFYPGDKFGQEFAFPEKLVAQLASAAPTALPMSYAEPAPVVTAQPAAAPEPSPASPQPEVQPAQPVPPAAPVAAAPPAPISRPAALPRTATWNPLIGFLGVASLSLAGLLTLATKKA